MNTTKAYSGTQSVSRALRLLKLFHAAPHLSFAEIRERSGLNRSTAFRLLTVLEAEGMVARDPQTEGFRLGVQIAALGRRASGEGDLRELARRHMEALAAELNETVTIEVLSGDRVTIVGEAMGDHVIGAMPSLGTSWPAHATSTGKVLLAALEPGERDALLRGRLAGPTERTITRKRDLVTECERVARRGYSVSFEELEPGYVAVAVPIVDGVGRTIAALSVGGPKHRLPRQRVDELAELLTSAAEGITGELGG